MPYRDAPPRSTPASCEICDRAGESLRCATCRAVLLELAVPVVLVAWTWRRPSPAMGVGIVLVDRGRAIASCACQVPHVRLSSEAMACARAALWAPIATIARCPDDLPEVLEHTLCRTRVEQHREIRACFEAAEWRARSLADDACFGNDLGAWLERAGAP